jgi:Glycine-zipper domain
MQHQRSNDPRTRRTVLGFPSFVILIAVPLLAATGLAQNNNLYNYPAMPAAPASYTYQPSQRHIVRGAGRGAALGAVGGAIAGDAGKGAAAGAWLSSRQDG